MAEVTGSRGVGNPLGTNRVQVGFVAPTVFDVLEAATTGKQVQCDVENVIRFVVGQVQFKKRNRLIDFFSQVKLLGQLEKRANPTSGDGLLLISQLVFDTRIIGEAPDQLFLSIRRSIFRLRA